MRKDELKVLHVAAWAQTFTQFRMPLLLEQREEFGELRLYFPEREYPGRGGCVDQLKNAGFSIEHGPISKTPNRRLPLEIATLFRFLRRRRFDVLIAHQPMGALVGITAALMAGVPVKIYSTGGLKYFAGNRGLKNSIVGGLERVLIGVADATLLVNKEDEELLKSSLHASKAHYVGPRGGCGIDTRVFSRLARREHRKAARAELGVDGGKTIVGYTGRYIWEKGFKEIVEAASILKGLGLLESYKFVFYGSGEEEQQIDEYCRSKGIRAAFRFFGYHPDIVKRMSAFDVFVLPSYREGLPVSLMEAMAMGIPSIASDIRGNRDLVQHMQTGVLIPRGSSERLAASLEQIRKDRELAEELGEAASEYIEFNYDERVLLGKTGRTIDEVIRRNLCA